MRCCLAAVGSRGDVAPLLTLATELVGRGHEVHVVVLADYADLAQRSGAVVHPVAAPQSQAMWPEVGWLRWLALAQPGVMYLLMSSSLARVGGAVADALLDAVDGADVLVAGTATRGALRRLAAARGVPVVTLLLAPLLPASRPEAGVLAPAVGGPVLARVVSGVLWRMTVGLGSGTTRAVVRRVGLGRPAHDRLVCATSDTLAHRQDDDPAWRTGWIPASAGTGEPLPPGLRRFLDEHPDAVLMGFGSCPSVSSRRDVALFRRVARRAGRPLVLQTRLLPPGLVDAATWNAPGADHRALLPRVAAVVHHGGAGTTLTALASGTPAVVVPHLGDQAWFARRVQQLGVGVAAAPRWRLTAAGLQRALATASRAQVVERARALGPVVAGEGTGAGEVADLLEACVSDARASRPPA